MGKVMIIELSALEVILNTGKEALKVLDIPQWGVKEGDRVAIWGPSASGKSTLLNVLAGLLPATTSIFIYLAQPKPVVMGPDRNLISMSLFRCNHPPHSTASIRLLVSVRFELNLRPMRATSIVWKVESLHLYPERTGNDG